jgi:hypothetical protein
MEADSGQLGWRMWRDWLLWWRIDPEELRRQMDGYDTLPMFLSARGNCLVIAVGLGVFQTIGGGALLWKLAVALQGASGWRHCAAAADCEAVIAFGAFAFATGLLFPILGRFASRGSTAAMGWMMALWTGVCLAVGSLWLFWSPYGISSAVTAAGAVFLVAGWGCVLRPLRVALRVERQRSGTAAEAASPALTGV